MIGKETAKVAGDVVHGLKAQPLALALVVVNVAFLLAGVWFLQAITGSSKEAAQRRDALMAQLAKDCIVIAPAK